MIYGKSMTISILCFCNDVQGWNTYEHGSLGCRHSYVCGNFAAYNGQKIYLMRSGTCMCQHHYWA